MLKGLTFSTRLVLIVAGLGVLLKLIGQGPASVVGDYVLELALVLLFIERGYKVTHSVRSSTSSFKRVALPVAYVLYVLVLGWVTMSAVIPFDVWFAHHPSSSLIKSLRQRSVGTQRLSPLDSGFSEAIVSTVGEHRLVGLGESHHFTREFPLTKVELIRRLHEEAGCDVVLFESPLVDLYLFVEAMKKNGDPRTGVEGLLPIWHTPELRALFQYALETRHTGHPLRIFGMDEQYLGPSSVRAEKFLEQAVSQFDPPSEELLQAQIEKWGGLLLRGKHRKASDPRVQEGAAYLRKLAVRLRARLDASDAPPASQQLQLHLAAMTAGGMADDLVRLTLSKRAATLLRDRRMAQNVIEYCDSLFPRTRVVLWAHNGHLWKDPAHQRLFWYDFPGNVMYWLTYGRRLLVPNMGSLLEEHFGQQYYALGLLASGGRVGIYNRLHGWRFVRYRRPDSLEAILRSAGENALFLDLSTVNSAALDTPLTFRSNGLQWRQCKVSEQFDGVVVLRHVSPSHRSSSARARQSNPKNRVTSQQSSPSQSFPQNLH